MNKYVVPFLTTCLNEWKIKTKDTFPLQNRCLSEAPRTKVKRSHRPPPEKKKCIISQQRIHYITCNRQLYYRYLSATAIATRLSSECSMQLIHTQLSIATYTFHNICIHYIPCNNWGVDSLSCHAYDDNVDSGF